MNNWNKIANYIQNTNLIKRYFIVTVLMLISAINYNLFLLPNHIVAGGSSGLSIIVEKVFGIKPSLFILIFCILTLVISAFILNKQKIVSAIYVTFIYPFFVELTTSIGNYIYIDQTDILIICIMSGIISGWVGGMVYKMGLNQGGMTLIVDILYKKCKMSHSVSTFIANGVIILMGLATFGLLTSMNAIILLYINSIVMNKVLLGISKNKTIYIFTNKEKEIKEHITNKLKYGVTLINSRGGYSKQKGNVFFTVIPTSEYYKFTHTIKKIDKQVFFTVTDSYQTIGEYKFTNSNLDFM